MPVRSPYGFGSATIGAFGLVLLVSLVLLDLGHRAGFVGNQTRIYALRPEATMMNA